MTKKGVIGGHLLILISLIISYFLNKMFYGYENLIHFINGFETIIYIIGTFYCFSTYKKTSNRAYFNLMLFLIFSLIGDLLSVYYPVRIYDGFYLIGYINAFMALNRIYKSFMLFKINTTIINDALILSFVSVYIILIFTSNGAINENSFDIAYILFDILMLFYVVMIVLKMTANLKIRRHIMYIIASFVFYLTADIIYFVNGVDTRNLQTSFADILYCLTGIYLILGMIDIRVRECRDSITSYIKSSLNKRSFEIYFAWGYSILLLVFVLVFIKKELLHLHETDKYFGVYIALFAIMTFRMYANIASITKEMTSYQVEKIFDKLTTFYKREAIPLILDKIKQFKYRSYPITLLLLDIDEMQSYNSLFGVQAGDIRIKTVANVINKNLGDKSICIRYGGDEFLVIFLGIKEEEVNSLIGNFVEEMANRNKFVEHQTHFTYYNITLNEDVDLEKAIYDVETNLSIRRLGKKEMVNELIEEKNRQTLEEQQLEVLKSFLKIVELKDRYTEGHSTRVAEYAQLIAKVMGLPEEDIRTIYTAGVLHDIGKVLIPTEILNKNGPLEQCEWDIMSMHPIYGYEIVSSLKILKNVAPLIRYHHERYNSNIKGHSGYPKEKWGEEIPLGARILCVADSFDAMITDRPYRKGMPIKKAAAIIKEEAGKQFDPKVVDAFIKVLEVALSYDVKE